jgi:HAD superfamily phosphatase
LFWVWRKVKGIRECGEILTQPLKRQTIAHCRHCGSRALTIRGVHCCDMEMWKGSNLSKAERSRSGRSRTKREDKLDPAILIFDVDGVLVDVKETYWRSGLQTIEKLTGKRATWAEFHRWKEQPGNNDDWRLVSRWATARGVRTSYEQARAAFQPFYWGSDGKPGNVAREKLLITPGLIDKWAARRELNLFTGRTRQEFAYTFDKWAATKRFRTVITMDDAKKKPNPEGLKLILNGRDAKSALYLGDNIDDALAAQAAGMPFMAILPKDAYDYPGRAKKFRELGALRLLERARDLVKWLE